MLPPRFSHVTCDIQETPHAVADTAFEKGGGTLTQNIQINGFWPEFYIKKKEVKFGEKSDILV